MAVRGVRGTGLRRAAEGRALALSSARGRALALVGLYGVAAVIATADALGSFRSAFIAGGADGYGEPAAGDHLQAAYRFWLVGHQLGNGDVPWRDPYSFQPLTEPQLNLNGWPFGLPFWPLDAAFGPVVAWNVLMLATIVAAGLATYGWLRQLRLPVPAAFVGGLAFALAPYRLAQSAGHLLGWIAVLIPLSLYAFERSRAAASRRAAHAWGFLNFAAIVSIALSGQLHLAVGALPFCLVYAVLRRRRIPLAWTAAGVVVAAGVGIALRTTIIGGSTAAAGRSIDQVKMFQAGWIDIVSRFRDGGLEQFVYVGWLTPLLAVAGLVVLARRRGWLAALFGVAIVVPLLFAVGTHTPIYEPIWRHFPPLHVTRVPGRLMPVATLAVAAMVAVAIAYLMTKVSGRRRLVLAGVATILVAADLIVLPFGPTAADPDNAAYAALAGGNEDRILELPVYEPGIHFGSIYHYYAMEEPRERPQGYSTLAPAPAYSFFWQYNRLNCGILEPGDAARMRTLGIEQLLFHRGAYEQSARPGAWFLWQALQTAGYRSTARGGDVWLVPLQRRPNAAPQPAPVPEPHRTTPVLCEGWRGWKMKERDAPLWVYGDADLELDLTAPGQTTATVEVDGDRTLGIEVNGVTTVKVPLEGNEWHSVVFEVPALFTNVNPPQGLEITRLSFAPE